MTFLYVIFPVFVKGDNFQTHMIIGIYC